MKLTVAMTKNDGVLEAALFIDDKYTRSAQGKSIMDIFTKLAGPILSRPTEDGTELAINVGLLTRAESERLERRVKRERETQEANKEAEELEGLVKAQDREARAKMELTQGDKPSVA